MRRRIQAAMVAASLLASGCDGYREARGKGDAPVGASNDQPAEVINFPNGFGNVATKCDGHGHRLFVVTHIKTDPAVTVIDDPTCPGARGR